MLLHGRGFEILVLLHDRFWVTVRGLGSGVEGAGVGFRRRVQGVW